MDREALKQIPYVDVEAVDDRRVFLFPLWDGVHWSLWIEVQDGSVERLRPMALGQGSYLTNGPIENENDLYFVLLDHFAQYLTFPEVIGFFQALEDDIHLLAVSAAKLEHFFVSRESIEAGLLASFVRSEIESILVTARSAFDLVQEITSRIWNGRVCLLDAEANRRKRQNKLPSTYSKVLLRGGLSQSTDQLKDKYALPQILADVYSEYSTFF